VTRDDTGACGCLLLLMVAGLILLVFLLAGVEATDVLCVEDGTVTCEPEKPERKGYRR
jgi:hypothetical protein